MINSDEIIKKVHTKLHNAMVLVADKDEKILKQSISTPYPPASEPYEEPHTRTGDLIAGITSDVDKLKLTVVSTADYSASLEFGTHKMNPRPFMRPMLQKIKRTFIPDLIKALQ